MAYQFHRVIESLDGIDLSGNDLIDELLPNSSLTYLSQGHLDAMNLASSRRYLIPDESSLYC